MPCYRFVIHTSDCTYDDPDGELFLSEEAARDHARRIIRELREDGFDPSSVLDVTDERGCTVHSIPFWAASFKKPRCATSGVRGRVRPMFDRPPESLPDAESSPTELRFQADACRALAEATDSPERKALWLRRAQYWEEHALKTAERLLESVKSGRDAATR